MSNEDWHNLLKRAQDRVPITVRVIPRKTWGGTFIANALPREGRRTHRHEPWDEEAGSNNSGAEFGAV